MRRIAILLIAAAPALVGQTLNFEVASVRPASAEAPAKDDYTAGFNAGARAALAAQGLRIRGQRVTVVDNTLRDLIRLAYEVKEYQISGPGWLGQDKFEIVATMPAGSDRSQAPGMLRNLLEQRFHLKVHSETRVMPVYALEAVKGGAKLNSSTARAGSGFANPETGRVLASHYTLAAFAELLSKAADRPVIDTTGIAGFYDFDLRYTADPARATLESPPALGVVLRDQLGLTLVKRDMPIVVWVVDAADRVPTEN